MAEIFSATGNLWLLCQEGGFADDAWVFAEIKKRVLPDGHAEKHRLLDRLYNTDLDDSDDCIGLDNVVDLDDTVAEFFGAERIMPSGNRHIGSVRITIERLERKG